MPQNALKKLPAGLSNWAVMDGRLVIAGVDLEAEVATSHLEGAASALVEIASAVEKGIRVLRLPDGDITAPVLKAAELAGGPTGLNPRHLHPLSVWLLAVLDPLTVPLDVSWRWERLQRYGGAAAFAIVLLTGLLILFFVGGVASGLSGAARLAVLTGAGVGVATLVVAAGRAAMTPPPNVNRDGRPLGHLPRTALLAALVYRSTCLGF